ncbi:MAG: beta-galactosidase [bacterium]
MLSKIRKIRNWVFVISLLLLAGVALTIGLTPRPDQIKYGVTFSIKQARDLELDWQQVYLAMLDDLKVRDIRLPAYWSEIEGEEGVYDWTNIDWLVDEAGKRDARIIMAVGGRLPRWPECHFPEWVKPLPTKERQDLTLNYIKATIERYKDKKNIVAWQVENEPFLPNFGECPTFDQDFLDNEISLIRVIDKRPVVVTDSGELSLWYKAANRADIFGTSIYRDTYSQALNRYIHYPISPTFFKVKKNLAKFFASPKKWVVIELQAEPWCKDSYQLVGQSDRDKSMSPEKFKNMLSFIQTTGFDEFYLWGVEWWYWEKTKQNRPIFWEMAKEIYVKN